MGKKAMSLGRKGPGCRQNPGSGVAHVEFVGGMVERPGEAMASLLRDDTNYYKLWTMPLQGAT
jgi:hypothetical protein